MRSPARAIDMHDMPHEAKERYFDAIASSTADMIVVLDAAGRRLYANQAFNRLFGEHSAEPGSDSFAEVHPDDRSRIRRLFMEVLASGKGARAEYRVIDRDGGIRYIESQSNVIDSPQSGAPRIVVVSRDTTDRRRYEDELGRLNRELESRIEARTAQLAASKGQLERTLVDLQAAHRELREREEDARRALDKERELNELKLRFVSMTSHEFRTPLTMILSASELLRNYDTRLSGDERQEVLTDIRNAVGRMTVMLDEVLTISRADAGRLELNPKPMAVAEFCRGLVRELEKACLHSHRLVLKAPAHDVTRLMDEKLLRLILTNLLSNAIKYSPAGSEVILCLDFEAGNTLFEVIDKGIGIPDEDQPRMFDTFFRAKNVGQIAGTGLGLAIVRRAVQRHNGYIACDSRVGVGTCFSLKIPVIGTESAS